MAELTVTAVLAFLIGWTCSEEHVRRKLLKYVQQNIVKNQLNEVRKSTASFEEVPLKEDLHTEKLITQALSDLLLAKGIITQEELLEQIQIIRKKL